MKYNNNNNNNIKSSLFHSTLTSLGCSTKFWIKVALSNQSIWVAEWLYNIRVLKWYFYNIFSNTFTIKFMWKFVTNSNLNPLLKLFFYSPILTNNNQLLKIYCENIMVTFDCDFLFFFLSFHASTWAIRFVFFFSFIFSPPHNVSSNSFLLLFFFLHL